jgi:LysR family transcriptional regulator, pca operon transcriptional activator
MRMADGTIERMGLHGMTQRLRLSLPRAVDAVEAHRSLLAASSVLGITQPALTKSLHELEEVVGARLFDRHSRGVRPTEAGQVFVEAARRVLAELRRLDDQLDQLASPGGGTVALGALPVAAAGILPGTLGRLKPTDPQIRVRLQEGRTGDLLPLLASGEIDLIVGQLYEPTLPDPFVREPLKKRAPTAQAAVHKGRGRHARRTDHGRGPSRSP